MEVNPWAAVAQLEEFLAFCCPECDVQRKDRESFIRHAIDKHPKSISHLKKFTAQEYEGGFVLKDDIKTEVDYDYYEDDYEIPQAHEEMDLLDYQGLKSDDYDDQNYALNYAKAEIDDDYEMSDIAEPDPDFQGPKKVPKKRGAIKKENDDPFICPTCGKNYSKKSSFQYHLEHCQPDTGEQLECDKCTYVTHKRILMENHKKRVHKTAESVNCDLCDQTFSSAKGVKEHKELKHISKEKLMTIPCHCHKCEKKFENSNGLNEHLKNCLEEAEKKNLKCCYCKSENWLSRIAVERHTAEDHQSLSKVCEVCDAVLSTQTYRRHIKAHKTKPEELKCADCEETFTYHPTYMKHRLKVHNDTSFTHYSCNYCEAKFIEKKMLEEHVNMKHTHENEYKCPQCKFTTYRKGGVEHHIKVVHERALACFCPWNCGEEFNSKGWRYQKHKKICDLNPDPDLELKNPPKTEDIKCPECDKFFSSGVYLRHYRRVHGSLPPDFPEDKKFVCEQCSDAFASKIGLEKHMKTHDVKHKKENANEIIKCKLCQEETHGKHGYLMHYKAIHGDLPPEMKDASTVYCEHCGKVFANKAYLKRHILEVHSETKPEKRKKTRKEHICQFCGTSFSAPYRLRNHVNTVHLKNLPFQCEHCPKKFPSQYRLKNHVSFSHSRVKCDLCNEIIYNSFLLARHKSDVHGVLPEDAFKCDHCSLMFRSKFGLENHVKTKHA